MMNDKLPRDSFIDILFQKAQVDSNIYFLSADFGAKALDKFRENIPDQFVHMGIAEQNMIDVAAGMAQSGKKVFCYAMSCFLSLRCLEQIKVALCLTNNPVVLLGVGSGLSYDDAGPTHYALEDISCLKSLPGMEVYAPNDNYSTEWVARRCLDSSTPVYVRLGRHPEPELLNSSHLNQLDQSGMALISDGTDGVLYTFGEMCSVALEVKKELLEENSLNLKVINVVRLNPICETSLVQSLLPKKPVITLEEHFLNGGFGSSVLESLNNRQKHNIPVLRLGLSSDYFFNNGGRDFLRSLYGLDKNSIKNKILNFYNNAIN